MSRKPFLVEPKKRGRPPSDPVDQLRAKIWYLAVKARGNWSDYRLDIEFVHEPDEQKLNGSDRRRSFERVRRHGIVPSSGTHRLRRYDLIKQVDAHPNFVGTAGYFYSPFWRLMKLQLETPVDLITFVQQCLTACRIHRASGELELVLDIARKELPSKESIRPSRIDIYTASLEMAFADSLINLDALALLGGLYREAYSANALEVALVVKQVLLKSLNEFCSNEWLGNEGRRLFDLAERRLLYWTKNADGFGAGFYDDDLECVVTRPLLQMNELTEEMIRNKENLYYLAIKNSR